MPSDWWPAAGAIWLAYALFGMTGFGAAMVAVPLLVHLFPLQLVVPLVVLFDLVATSLVGGRNWRLVDRTELQTLLPSMLLGIVVGVVLLRELGPRWPLVALGVFVLGISLRNLLARDGATQPALARGWAWPFGTIGGVFSALFGTGGPIYTIYLSRRLRDVNAFRATIAVVILLSAIIRAGAFGVAGLYGQPHMLQLALWLLPVALLGLWAGSRLRTQVSAAVLKRLVLLLLSLGGAGAIYRGLTAAA